MSGIYVTLSTFSKESPVPGELLESSGFRHGINPTGKRLTGDELVERARGYEVLVAGVEEYTAEVMDRLPGLKAISRCGVGTEAIDHEAANARGIAILNTPDEPVQAVAEHALTLMLGLLRELPKLDALTRGRKWERITGHLLNGRTVGIIGLGRIGREVGRLTAAFGARVLGYDPIDFPLEGIERVGSMRELLSRCDLVTIHAAPGTVALGREELQLMPKGGWLVNTARGGMVDESALLEFLQSGHLTGAALDVFEDEPYRGPLCDCDRVILTPHQATLTFETRVAMECKAVQNAIDCLQVS